MFWLRGRDPLPYVLNIPKPSGNLSHVVLDIDVPWSADSPIENMVVMII